MSSGHGNGSEQAENVPAAGAALGLSDGERSELREQVLEALKVVFDPEIPVNIVDLGLVYDVAVNDSRHVDITMTLTTIGCPVQDMIQSDTELAAMQVDGVDSAMVEFVWSPPWSLAQMTEAGKKQMRMFGFSV